MSRDSMLEFLSSVLCESEGGLTGDERRSGRDSRNHDEMATNMGFCFLGLGVVWAGFPLRGFFSSTFLSVSVGVSSG